MTKKLAIADLASAIKIGLHGVIAPLIAYYYIGLLTDKPFPALIAALITLAVSEMGYYYLKPESRDKFMNVATVVVYILTILTFLLSITVDQEGFYVLR